MEKVKLGDLTNIKTGRLDANASSPNGKYPFFTCAKEISYIDNYAFEGESVLVAGNGDLNVKHYNGKFNAYQRTYVIQRKVENLDLRYLYFFLEKYLEYLRHQSIGGVIKYIKLGNLTDAKIPLPSLSEQKSIAVQLDKADELIRYNRQLIEKYDELQQSLFLEMFGDPVMNEKGWEKKKLGEISEISSGSTPSREKEEYFNGNIPWIKTGEVNGKIIYKTSEKITELALKETSCTLYPKGSLIIAMYGQGKTRGQVGMLGLDATTNQACAVLHPTKDMNYIFLMSLLKLNYEDLRELGRGGNQPNLNIGIVKNYSVLFPPLSLQNEFASHIASIEYQKDLVKEALSKSEDIFNGLLQEFFGG